jgi:hypothetical protein
VRGASVPKALFDCEGKVALRVDNTRRFRATAGVHSKAMNVLRAISSEGLGRLKYHQEIRRRLDTDPEFRPYFEQQTTRLPRFYAALVRRDLGPLWRWLPEGALDHDPNAYLAAERDHLRPGRGQPPGPAGAGGRDRESHRAGRRAEPLGAPRPGDDLLEPPGGGHSAFS